MANPQPVFWGLSSDALINATTTGYVWLLGPDKTIDWSVAGGMDGEFWINPEVVAQGLSRVLATFSYYADVKFNFVGYYSNPVSAAQAGSDITISLSGNWSFFPSSNIWARAMFSWPGYRYYPGDAGDVFLNINSQANYLSSYAPGSAGWFVFMHELGHALGLKHPHDGADTGRPTLSQLGLDALNEDWGTIMSYADDYNWNLRQWDPATPMALDVIALQYLYGPNTTTNAGDSTYFVTRHSFYETLWDASGNDTIDLSLSNEGWLVFLPFLQPSSVVPTKVGLVVPVADVQLSSPLYLQWLTGDIENVKGSAFGDALFGPDSANRMDGAGGDDAIYAGGGNDAVIGGFGNDTLDGGSGLDTALYSGSWNQYRVQRTSATAVLISGPDGSDSLTDVERLVVGTTKVALDITGDAGEAYRLYQAAFDRTPDVSGLGFWINALDMGIKLTDVAASFISSPEFQATYGNLDTAHFVIQLYENVLHRGPDGGGLSFWEKILDTAAAGRADVLAAFSESPENQANVIGQISNGIIYT